MSGRPDFDQGFHKNLRLDYSPFDIILLAILFGMNESVIVVKQLGLKKFGLALWKTGKRL